MLHLGINKDLQLFENIQNNKKFRDPFYFLSQDFAQMAL